MSTQKGNQKKNGQRYQNTRKFVVTFNETYQKMADRAPMDRLCPTCKSQIEWKIQYGKYKPPQAVSRCVRCQNKAIFKAYRQVCDKCSDDKMCCSKCLDPREPDEDNDEVGNEKEMQYFMEGLRERSKRTVDRKLAQGAIAWSKEKKCFIDVESGKQLDNLQFKQSYFDEEDEELWDDCDEDEEDDEEEDEEDYEDDEDDEEDNEEEDEEQELNVKATAKAQLKQGVKKEKQKHKHAPSKPQQKSVQAPQQGTVLEQKPAKEVLEQRQVLEQSEVFEQREGLEEREVLGQQNHVATSSDEDYMICRDEYSDGSRDLDHWQRPQKNYRFYFTIKDYPEDDEQE